MTSSKQSSDEIAASDIACVVEKKKPCMAGIFEQSRNAGTLCKRSV